jgi:SOS response regulatory protein OraA/RecX
MHTDPVPGSENMLARLRDAARDLLPESSASNMIEFSDEDAERLAIEYVAIDYDEIHDAYFVSVGGNRDVQMVANEVIFYLPVDAVTFDVVREVYTGEEWESIEAAGAVEIVWLDRMKWLESDDFNAAYYTELLFTNLTSSARTKQRLAELAASSTITAPNVSDIAVKRRQRLDNWLTNFKTELARYLQEQGYPPEVVNSYETAINKLKELEPLKKVSQIQAARRGFQAIQEAKRRLTSGEAEPAPPDYHQKLQAVLEECQKYTAQAEPSEE